VHERLVYRIYVPEAERVLELLGLVEAVERVVEGQR
jgi:hypothetical protein